MKRNFTKHIIAAVSAAMLTMSMSTGVMAASTQNQQPQPPAGIEQPAPEQGQQQMPPQGAPGNGEKPTGEKPTGEMPTGEMPAGEKPEGEMPAGEMPAEVKPADQPAQNDVSANPVADNADDAQKAADKETMNLFQKFLQWLKGLSNKN